MTNGGSMSCSAARRASPNRPLTQREMDLAASRPAGHRRSRDQACAARRQARPGSAIFASPVAWRSIASPTASCCARACSSNIWLQPAAGDAGGALGAALAAYHLFKGATREPSMRVDGCAAAISARSSRRTDVERALDSGRRTLPGFIGRRDARPLRASARRRGRRSAGIQGAWNSGRARWAVAPSSAMRARRRCRSMLNLKVKYRESLSPVRAGGVARGRRRLVRDR